MTYSDQSLVKKLVFFLIIKLIFLVGLWWFFIKETRVITDEKSVAAHLMSTPVQTTPEGTP